MFLVGFSGLSTYPAVSSKVRLFCAMAPVAHLGHMSGVLKYAVPLVQDLQWLYRLAGYGQFLPPTKLLNKLEVEMCRNVDVLFKQACISVYYLVGGQEPVHQLNTSRLDVYFSHTPSGTSTLNVSTPAGRSFLRKSPTPPPSPRPSAYSLKKYLLHPETNSSLIG